MKTIKFAILSISFLITTDLIANQYVADADVESFFSSVVTSADKWEIYQEKLRAIEDNRFERNHPPKQYCNVSTWCPRGYKIWCYAEGSYCSSNKGERSWVWCASYDPRGRITYQGTDRCR